MPFKRDIPTAPMFQSDSQPLIRDNFNSSDDSFGVDHYKFSNSTASNGFHNKVTTPIIAPVPPNPSSVHPTTGTNVIMYAMQDTANIGLLQYSRGPNDAVPSPITELHSSTSPLAIGANGTINVLDFTGISFAIATLYMINASNSSSSNNFIGISDFMFHLRQPGAIPVFNFSNSGTTLRAQASTLILQIHNTDIVQSYNNIFWTLRFYRIVI